MTFKEFDQIARAGEIKGRKGILQMKLFEGESLNKRTYLEEESRLGNICNSSDLIMIQGIHYCKFPTKEVECRYQCKKDHNKIHPCSMLYPQGIYQYKTLSKNPENLLEKGLKNVLKYFRK